MKRMSKIFVLVLAAVLIFTLTACGNSSVQSTNNQTSDSNQSNSTGSNSNNSGSNTQENITLRFSWWGGDARHEATLKAIELYESKHPNIKIEPEYSSFTGYYEKLITQITSGNAPDFFQVDQGWVAELYSRGDAFADLSKYDVLDISTFPETMVRDYCRFDDEIVVLPFGYNGTVFLYNKTLLADWCDENGKLQVKTWDDFIRVGKELHEKDPEAYMTTAVTDGYLRYILKPMLEQITNEIDVKDDFTLGFNVEQMTQAYNSFLEIFKNNVSQPFEESVLYDSMQNNPLWLNGKIGGIFLFFSNIDTEIAGLNYDFDVIGMPMFEGAKLSGQESCPSLMVAINKNTTSLKQEAAAEFLNWFLNSEEASVILGTVRGVPASSAALDTLRTNNILSELLSKGITISNETISLKNGSYEMNSSVKAIYVDYMEKVIFGMLTPEQAAAGMYEDLTALLKELSGQ
jgi:oligogalacturonide transport system substrate-binding protein